MYLMPNLDVPITSSIMAIKYKKEIEQTFIHNSFIPLIPCYLTDNINLKDFKKSLEQNIFVGAKLYPLNTTTNSSKGVSKIEKIFPCLEILEKTNKNLLIHGEKSEENINLFDRENFFTDDELVRIREKFPNLKIILEHVSSKYGADFVAQNKNIAGTITPHHMLLTKKDVFSKRGFNPYNFCMPVVKNEKDLIALRKYACSGNAKFFLGTDSAPHQISNKNTFLSSKPGKTVFRLNLPQ